jgi:hypothetical protein
VDKCVDWKTLWRKLSVLLQPPASSEPSHAEEQFAMFIGAKMTPSVPQALTRLYPPFSHVPCFDTFATILVDEMDKLIMGAPQNQFSLDPAPTWLIKRFHHILAPVTVRVVNASLSEATFPCIHKSAIVSPLINKVILNPLGLNFDRPI